MIGQYLSLYGSWLQVAWLLLRSCTLCYCSQRDKVWQPGVMCYRTCLCQRLSCTVPLCLPNQTQSSLETSSTDSELIKVGPCGFSKDSSVFTQSDPEHTQLWHMHEHTNTHTHLVDLMFANHIINSSLSKIWFPQFSKAAYLNLQQEHVWAWGSLFLLRQSGGGG